jgi:hypothetical protein
MPLLGPAAMLLTFDIVEGAIAEHDDWHTHEHLPERLSIPGFLRGTRWIALHGAPRYLVLYEVVGLETLDSSAYLERLDHPTPWTAKMMTHYRGMIRGLCSVTQSCGLGMGHVGLLLRFKPANDAQTPLDQWLGNAILPRLPMRPGLGSAHLLQSALSPKMTTEQRIRGDDAGMGCALLVTGYLQAALLELAQTELAPTELEQRGATRVVSTIYQAAYTLSAGELHA